jgi:ABC-2 type transport system ATP-binding protein
MSKIMQKAIEIINVKKKISGREILKGISFDINKGDIFGYLGANGAGKTTTIRILLDLLSIDSGSVLISGKNSTAPDARNMIGFVLDADGLYNNLNCFENLEFYSNLYGKQAGNKKIDALLDVVGLSGKGNDKVGTFSKGMRQRLALARALVHDPEILILDEPLSGIDPPGQMEIRKVLLDIVKIHNKTIFFSSHNLDEVQRLCNRIALIDFGEIKLYGDLKQLLTQNNRNQVDVKIAGSVNETALTQLKKNEKIQDAVMNGNLLSLQLSGNASVNDVIPLLTAAGLLLEEITKKQSSLEEMYNEILKQRGK